MGRGHQRVELPEALPMAEVQGQRGAEKEERLSGASNGESTVADAVGSQAASLSQCEPRKGRSYTSCGSVLHSLIQSLIQQAYGRPTVGQAKSRRFSCAYFDRETFQCTEKPSILPATS